MENASPPPGPVRTCPSCKSPIEPGHNFCEICGTRIPDLPPCRKCGAIFIAPVKFCEMCGTPVPEKVPEQAPRDEPVRPAPEPLEPDGTEDTDEELDEKHPDIEPAQVRAQPAKMAEVPLPADPLAPAFSGLSDLPDQPAKTPQKPSMNKVLIGGGIIVIIVLAAAVYFIGLPLLNGGGPGPMEATTTVTPELTPVPTLPTPLSQTPEPEPEPALTMPVYSMEPEPTQEMPENQEVFFQVEKDPITAKITVIFAGGAGINTISSGEVTVTRGDGTVLYGSIRPSSGVTELVLDGSKGTDRVEVIAVMHSGQSYRVYDDLLSFRSR